VDHVEYLLQSFLLSQIQLVQEDLLVKNALKRNKMHVAVTDQNIQETGHVQSVVHLLPSFPLSQIQHEQVHFHAKNALRQEDSKNKNTRTSGYFYFCAVIIHFARTFFERKLNEWISPATASQSLGGHQRKMFLAFRIYARPISSKKERTFFFGVLPSKYSGRWRD